jgi:antirestriction protein ArdC
MGRIRWGDEGYAKEELVAELGSAFLCADLEITPEVREDHAAYIGHWLKALQDDKRLIFSAAAHAQRAADYLHSLQPKQIEEDGPPHKGAVLIAHRVSAPKIRSIFSSLFWARKS